VRNQIRQKGFDQHFLTIEFWDLKAVCRPSFPLSQIEDQLGIDVFADGQGHDAAMLRIDQMSRRAATSVARSTSSTSITYTSTGPTSSEALSP
jgi:hypothetical protein